VNDNIGDIKPVKCAKSIGGNKEIVYKENSGNYPQITIHSGRFNERLLFYKLKTTR
jgi:hypothetical protein